MTPLYAMLDYKFEELLAVSLANSAIVEDLLELPPRFFFQL